ncbi:MAG TPA: SPOR domain-containing protein [Gammaproteobacteria bacterium]|nr:SPOR domain-containing protein [Gammaproteobacteria bacterium]
MEIGLKERLIGAAVLVVLGVIIIPLFLKSSPSPDSTVNQPLTLPPSSSTGTQQYSLPLDSTATMPAAATPASTAAAPVPVPVPATKPAVHAIPRPTPVAPAPAAVPAPSVSGKWLVQAGSYGSTANAEKVVATLKKHGIHATVSHFIKAGHTYYRVRIGPYTERAEAEKAAAAVAKAYGGKAEVVPNA